MKFTYIARTEQGETDSGVIESSGYSEARKSLLGKNLIVVSLEPLKEKAKSKFSFLFSGGISLLDKIIFAKHLSLMIKGGLSLRASLVTIQEQSKNKRFKDIIDSVINGIDNGQPLATALSRYPKAFDAFYINMIKIGEESGSLRDNLDHLASQLERTYELKEKIKGAMIYPLIILITVLVLSGGITIFILPKIMPLFRIFNIDLPLATKILIWVTEFLKDYGVILLIALIVAAFLFYLSLRVRAIKLFFHKFILRVPVFGVINRNVNLVYFTQNLGTLLKSGVPIVSALDITQATLENLIYKREVREIIEEVKKGISISDCLDKKERIFPLMVSRMIAVGEKTGNLEDTLVYMSDFYGKEVIKATQNLSTILEPVLMIIIGIIVGFVALAIISPIYELTRGLRL